MAKGITVLVLESTLVIPSYLTEKKDHDLE